MAGIIADVVLEGQHGHAVFCFFFQEGIISPDNPDRTKKIFIILFGMETQCLRGSRFNTVVSQLDFNNALEPAFPDAFFQNAEKLFRRQQIRIRGKGAERLQVKNCSRKNESGVYMYKTEAIAIAITTPMLM